MTNKLTMGRQKSSNPRRIRVRGSLYAFTLNDMQSLDLLRKRLRRMSDHGLKRFIQDAQYMSAGADFPDTSRESFVVQLREAQEVWKRRHPDNELTPPQEIT